MPKKGGKKGGKKGKKSGKKAKKEESADKKALANEKIWQARLRVVEKTKNDFRESAQHLATRNDLLQNQMKQIELDTIDVITFLKGQDQKKDGMIDKLQEEVKKVREQQEKEQKTLEADYNEQIKSLEADIDRKQDDIVLMQNELRHVKEFRKKRVAMQRELDEIKDHMFLAEKEHKDDVEKITQKFLDEKKEMQQDTNHKISVLADSAHQQAIQNLDETTRSVYKENVRLTEALRFHRQECERLRQENHDLEESNEKLKQGEDDLEAAVQESVAEAQLNKLNISKAEEKIEALEEALRQCISKSKRDLKSIKKYSAVEAQASDVEISKLERLLQLKTYECARVRKLARNILSQRTDMENTFIQAMAEVKREFAYESGVSPDKVTVPDLPWPARELVLRLLFSQMNAAPSAVHKAERQRREVELSSPVQQAEFFLPEDDAAPGMTFLTQDEALLEEVKLA